MRDSKGLVSVLLCGLLGQAGLAQIVSFQFNPLPPGPPRATHVLVLAINERGNMVGLYSDSALNHGFYLESALSADYVSIEYPGATYTVASGIDDKGEIAGYYGSRESGKVGRGDHGFVFRDGKFNTVDYPGAAGTRLYAARSRRAQSSKAPPGCLDLFIFAWLACKW